MTSEFRYKRSICWSSIKQYKIVNETKCIACDTTIYNINGIVNYERISRDLLHLHTCNVKQKCCYKCDDPIYTLNNSCMDKVDGIYYQHQCKLTTCKECESQSKIGTGATEVAGYVVNYHHEDDHIILYEWCKIACQKQSTKSAHKLIKD